MKTVKTILGEEAEIDAAVDRLPALAAQLPEAPCGPERDQGFRFRFNPIAMRGEPLSQTVLRERK